MWVLLSVAIEHTATLFAAFRNYDIFNPRHIMCQVGKMINFAD